MSAIPTKSHRNYRELCYILLPYMYVSTYTYSHIHCSVSFPADSTSGADTGSHAPSRSDDDATGSKKSER